MTLRYSQNFLRNVELVNALLDKSTIGFGDVVYEIGPGRGLITEQLARRCRKVVAIEKDPELFEHLRQKFAGNNRVEVKLGDFLKHNLLQGEYKVFANVPFNLTADIITKLTSADNPPRDTYLIVQKEAAQRFMGTLYGKETQISLLLKPWFELTIVQELRRTDFEPVPSVDTVLLQIKRRQQPLIGPDKAQLYRDFIVYGFNQWESSLKKALREIFTHPQFVRLAKNLKFPRSAKPTDLNFDQWLGLFNYFLVGVEKSKKDLIRGAEVQLRRQQARLQKDHRTRIRR